MKGGRIVNPEGGHKGERYILCNREFREYIFAKGAFKVYFRKR